MDPDLAKMPCRHSLVSPDLIPQLWFLKVLVAANCRVDDLLNGFIQSRFGVEKSRFQFFRKRRFPHICVDDFLRKKSNTGSSDWVDGIVQQLNRKFPNVNQNMRYTQKLVLRIEKSRLVLKHSNREM